MKKIRLSKFMKILLALIFLLILEAIIIFMLIEKNTLTVVMNISMKNISVDNSYVNPRFFY